MSAVQYKEKLCETVLYYNKQIFKLVFYNDKCTKFDLYGKDGKVGYTYSFKDTLFNGIYAFPGPHGTYFVTRNSYIFVLRYPSSHGFKPLLLDNTIIRIRNPEKNQESVVYYGEQSFAYLRKVFNAKTQMYYYVCFHCNHATFVRSIAKSDPEKEDTLGKLQSVYSDRKVFCVTSLKKNKKKMTRITFHTNPLKPYRSFYQARFTDLPVSFDSVKGSGNSSEPVFMEGEHELVIFQPGTNHCWKLNKEGTGPITSSDEVETGVSMQTMDIPKDIQQKVQDQNMVANFTKDNSLYMTDKDGALYCLNLLSLQIEPVSRNQELNSLAYESKLRTTVFTNDRAEALQASTIASSVGTMQASTILPPATVESTTAHHQTHLTSKVVAPEVHKAAPLKHEDVLVEELPKEEPKEEIQQITSAGHTEHLEPHQPAPLDDYLTTAALMTGVAVMTGLDDSEERTAAHSAMPASAEASCSAVAHSTESAAADPSCDAAALMTGVVVAEGLE